MTEFTVRGSFKSRDDWQTFERPIEAPTENAAREKTFAEFGSKHGLKRLHVEVDEVFSDASVDRDEAQDADGQEAKV